MVTAVLLEDDGSLGRRVALEVELPVYREVEHEPIQTARFVLDAEPHTFRVRNYALLCRLRSGECVYAHSRGLPWQWMTFEKPGTTAWCEEWQTDADRDLNEAVAKFISDGPFSRQWIQLQRCLERDPATGRWYRWLTGAHRP